MKVLRKMATLLAIAAIAFSIATPAFAAKPYKDLYVGSNITKIEYKCVKYLKKHHAFDGVIKEGGKYRPMDSFTGKQLKRIFRNVFGKKNTPITKSDKKFWKKPITSRYLITKLEAVSKKLGAPLTWWSRGCDLVLPRRETADFIEYFCSMNKKYRPRK